MAPKHALLFSSGPEVGGVNDKGDPGSSSPAAWMLNAGMLAVCSPGNGKRTRRALDGMLARWFVTVGAVLMLMMQSSSAADGKTPMPCYVPTCKSGLSSPHKYEPQAEL
ncbi:hypothetical protein GBF38_020893 [Nibea albiflora]|uniref:Uncharacterized protein n=1 Tax=Nibea albiflora TaxID=240163 RepID=A0ACB7FFA7_NIBAL|nr:hypothetical protein GBF38_020893 [Nibea albiflora]